MNLQGATAVITGGSSGLEFAVARELVEHGARVIVAARTKDKLDKAASALGQSAEARALDVTDAGEVAKFFESLGEFDHLVTPRRASPWGRSPKSRWRHSPAFSPASSGDSTGARATPRLYPRRRQHHVLLRPGEPASRTRGRDRMTAPSERKCGWSRPACP